MSLDFTIDGRVGTVSLTGRVTSAVLLEPLLAIAREARFSGTEAILVDFSRCRALRPCALGAMVEVCSRQRPDIRLGFCGLPASARDRLRRDGLDQSLPLYTDLAAARSAPGFVDLILAGKRALILCGAPASFLPVGAPSPVALADILGRPLVVHLLRHLAAEGIRDVVIEPGPFEAELRRALDRHAPTGMSLSVLHTASDRLAIRPEEAVARLAQSGVLPEDDLVVLDGSTMSRVDLRSMMSAHRVSGAEVTAAVPLLGMPAGHGLSEWREEQTHFTLETASPIRLAGAFILGAATVAQAPGCALHALGSAHLDRGIAARDGIAFHGCARPTRRIETARDLWQEQFERLEGSSETSPAGTGNSSVAPDVRLDGTVYLGEGVRIEQRARITGPSFVGEGVTIAAGASIRRSVVLPGTRVGKNAVLADCVVGPAGAHPIMQTRQVRDLKLSVAPVINPEMDRFANVVGQA